MTKYEFNKNGINEMYNDTMEEIMESLENGKIDNVKFEIKFGEQVMEIPNNADNFEEIFYAIKECLKIEENLKETFIKQKIEEWENFYNENGELPANCITLETEDTTIINPFMSECGRFEVNPIEYYGLEPWNEYMKKWKIHE